MRVVHVPRIIAGTKAMNNDSTIGGMNPWMNPRIGVGSLLRKSRKGAIFVKDSILDSMPTSAEGIDQKMMAAAMRLSIANRRTVRCHHGIAKVLQTTSSGRIPSSRGDICNGL